MRIRPLLCLIIILMGCSLLRSLAATEEDSHEELSEDSHEELSVETEVTDDVVVKEPVNDHESLTKKINNTVATKQKGRSIKMIVGGQSTDGLAKQVSMPIDD